MPEIKKITLRLNMDVPEEKAVYEFLADRKPYRKIIMEAVDALRFRQSEEKRQKMYLHEIQIAVEKCFQNVQERLSAMPQIISQSDDSIVQQSEEVEEGIDLRPGHIRVCPPGTASGA